MKKSITLSLAITLLTAPAFGFKQEDLDKLKATNGCEKCNPSKANLNFAKLPEANLPEADLESADLSGAVLRDAELDYAVLIHTGLCNTVMPDGRRIFQDCSRSIDKEE